MRVRVESILTCTPEQAWKAVQTSALLARVSSPLLRFKPVEPNPVPECWQEGMSCQLELYLFGCIPLGQHRIKFVSIDANKQEMRTEEAGVLIRKWNHVISLRADAGGDTVYTDEVEIEAGALTFPVWAFANWFYRHRHRRWRRLAKELRDDRQWI